MQAPEPQHAQHAQHAQRPAPCPALSWRQQALRALCVADPAEKVAATHALWAALPHSPDFEDRLEAGATLQPDPASPLPGRPTRPVLLAPMRVPHRSPFTPEGLAALVHAVCHIEFNAINLALDAVWRFPGMPPAFYSDWLRVADEEATHFGLLHTHLQTLGYSYGDFPAHDGLWEMCIKTQDDITARMALVPRTLEARGLDATPLIQARLRKVNTPAALRAIDILDIILRDEIGHVAVGNRWYGWLCAQQGLEPLAHYRALARQHNAPRLKPPFNDTARRAAGFTQQELDALVCPEGV
ncbi:MAG: ferritin-like domain-containing protein [Hydrogenophaga sp.]|nr:ferritin-like domain-containing protein [Hydrogenophaga sp.]